MTCSHLSRRFNERRTWRNELSRERSPSCEDRNRMLWHCRRQWPDNRMGRHGNKKIILGLCRWSRTFTGTSAQSRVRGCLASALVGRRLGLAQQPPGARSPGIDVITTTAETCAATSDYSALAQGSPASPRKRVRKTLVALVITSWGDRIRPTPTWRGREYLWPAAPTTK